MFTLVTDRSKYYRIKRGQSAEEVQRELKTPVSCAFDGAIVPINRGKLEIYSARVGDTYRIIAQKFGADEEQIKKLNGGKPVYPTCKLFVPCK